MTDFFRDKEVLLDSRLEYSYLSHKFIGETHEDYRGKGLAAVLSDRMCEHILEVGKKPVWAHSSSNLGSMKTALKCGFVQDKINTVIRNNDSGG